ncbi:MAG: glycosyltransferase [Rhizomicrobium sp.]
MAEALDEVCPPGSGTLSVSIILVVRNGAQFIADALASVQRAGRKPLEILLIDGHSTDATVEIATRFPGVRIVAQDGSGIPAAYNQGIAQARADTIAFISHDDIWMDGKLDLQLRAMEADASLQFTVGMVEHFLAGSAPPPGFRLDLLDRPVPGLIMEALVARKTVFDQVGLFDTSFAVAEDTDWFARAKDAGVAMTVLPDILVRKRVHENNSSLNTANINQLLLRALRGSIDRKAQKLQQGPEK